MLGILPIFAGLLACMPEYVPLGNPEKSRVDPEMNGYWFLPGDDPTFGGVLVLEPWDKRTWLMLFIGIKEKDDVDIGDAEVWTYDGFIDHIGSAKFDVDDHQFGVVPYKAWTVKLKGHLFFTWELRGIRSTDESDMQPAVWFDLRILEKSPDRLVLDLIDPSFEPLAEAPATRRGWEKVIRRHIEDEDLYLQDPIELTRVQADDMEVILEFVSDALSEGM